MANEPKGPYSIDECRGIAARCWCDKRTETTEMHVGLAEVVAEAIQKAWLAGRASRDGLRKAAESVMIAMDIKKYRAPRGFFDMANPALEALDKALAEDAQVRRA